MTYKERYQQTNSWTARHVANDLMMMNGRDAEVSPFDEAAIKAAEISDNPVEILTCGHQLSESETAYYERYPDLDRLCGKCVMQERAR